LRESNFRGKTKNPEKLDHLARDLMVQETIIRDLRQKVFEIVSVAEPDLCSDDPSRTRAPDVRRHRRPRDSFAGIALLDQPIREVLRRRFEPAVVFGTLKYIERLL